MIAYYVNGIQLAVFDSSCDRLWVFYVYRQNATPTIINIRDMQRNFSEVDVCWHPYQVTRNAFLSCLRQMAVGDIPESAVTVNND